MPGKGKTMNTRKLVHGTTALALLFLIGSSCSDNSAEKAQLARMDQYMRDQQALNEKDRQLAAQTAYNKCIDANRSNVGACDAIKPPTN